jgi:alpha-L-arabinofuranosidase
MRHLRQTFFVLVSVILFPAGPGRCAAPSATLTVDAAHPGVRISPTLWGIFFEDINLSADGGIYPELVRNRSFEDSPQPEHWSLATTGSAQAKMAIDDSVPLDPVNRHSLRLAIGRADGGQVRLVNEGYWGMAIARGASYRLSLWARSAGGFRGPLTATIEGRSGAVLAEGAVDGLAADWKLFSLDLTARGTDPHARLVLGTCRPGTLWLDMVSLMPKRTWKGHGLRPDLAGMLAGLRPSFVRFPGGCWVEGDELRWSYRWKRTIGEPARRVPLWNLWKYYATHGLGFHEYLVMCEDLGAEPLFVINCGMSHRQNVPMDQMRPWVQDALDAIEYANGPATSKWGAVRAAAGHSAPFHLTYMEIGNENGGPPYQERYALFYDAIKARHPEIRLVANMPTEKRPADIVDEHYYSNPEFFMAQSERYDSYPRSGAKVYVGEYAVTENCGRGNLRGALGEAAFMTGIERNSDVVVMASYAPLLVNVNQRTWSPDLIDFDSSRVYGIPSYYAQKLFSENRGDVVLPLRVACPLVGGGETGGAIGVGTWLTQAEFKDIKVTRDGKTLLAGDFAQGTKGWRLLSGQWTAQDGVLRQTSPAENVRALAGDRNWRDYTYSLKARKLGGAEGFLILFRVQNDQEKAWWNLGGWGNVRHAIELGGTVSNGVPGRIETGRWYDIRIELRGGNIKCYLDGKLIHDVTQPAVKALYASASHVDSTGEIILKVVNVTPAAQEAEVELRGAGRVEGPAALAVLTSASPADENSLEQPRKVAPVTGSIDVPGPVFRHTFPAYSISVLRLKEYGK